MKIVQINAVYGYSSTGRIVKELHEFFLDKGFKSYVFSTSRSMPSRGVFKIGNKLDYKIHGLLSRVFGLQGCFSFLSTYFLLRKIDFFKPDIVHLHNLHANFINIKMLLNYLAKRNIGTVVTLHDCWFYTGHCCHYTEDNCQKWRSHCTKCPILNKYNKSWIFDNSSEMFSFKKKLFQKIQKLAVVGNSNWTKDQANLSFFSSAKSVSRIYNWINLEIFYPRNTKQLRVDLGIEPNKFIVLGVSQLWSHEKGLYIFTEIAKKKPDIIIILIGKLNINLILPSNVILISEIKDANILAEYYSLADVFISPSKQETFGLVSAEALACGTPIIVNNATANPELAGFGSGYVVDNNSLSEYMYYVDSLRDKGKSLYSNNCTDFARTNFSLQNNIEQYIDLYKSMIDEY